MPQTGQLSLLLFPVYADMHWEILNTKVRFSDEVGSFGVESTRSTYAAMSAMVMFD